LVVFIELTFMLLRRQVEISQRVINVRD
jgi:hypothetical protein